ncbi:GFA family protein [Myxococcota bacterium]
MIRGSCLCKKVTFAVRGPVQSMSSCHCSRCRKAYGSAFGTIAVVATRDFAYVSGKDLIVSYDAGRVKRPFCRHCGSRLPLLNPGDPLVGIPAGLLDDDPGCRPTQDIFVASKAPWWKITGNTEQHATWPPDFEPDPPWDPALNGKG